MSINNLEDLLLSVLREPRRAICRPACACIWQLPCAMKNWMAWTRYCEDGDLAIDNCHTERSLRGIAVRVVDSLPRHTTTIA